MKVTDQIDALVLEFIKENPGSYSYQIRSEIVDDALGITPRKVSRSMTRLYNAGKITCDADYKYTIKQ